MLVLTTSGFGRGASRVIDGIGLAGLDDHRSFSRCSLEFIPLLLGAAARSASARWRWYSSVKATFRIRFSSKLMCGSKVSRSRRAISSIACRLVA